MEVIYTKEAEWLEKWDAFVIENPRASHLMLSDWLKSYNSYGFDFELGIVKEKDLIIGGFGVIIPKVLFLKFYIIPHGPIMDKDYEDAIVQVLDNIYVRAKQLGCCYTQVSLPISSNFKIKDYVFDPLEMKTPPSYFRTGKLFNYVYCSYGLNWVDFNGQSDSESYLETLSPKVRRNIRLPYRKNTRVCFVENMEDLKVGYDVIQRNANEADYKVRSFDDIKNTILSLIESNQAYFINIYVDDVVKASTLFIRAGSYFTNIMGGVVREKPDIKLGYMLQWEVIKKSFDLGFKGYNISMGGSEGVKEFKERFGAEAIFYSNSNYYSIIKPWTFKIYNILEKRIKPYKYLVANLLSKLR